MDMTSRIPTEARAILVVDDEPMACKWFARSFSREFTVLMAGSVDQALDVLREHSDEIAVLVTDFRMPERNGLELLGAVQQNHRHVVRLLLSAFADKDVTIAAVNKGLVFRILEKPLDEEATRAALRAALAFYQQRAHRQIMNEGRAAAMRETLGFLAHELNTPLAIVRGHIEALKRRLPTVDAGTGSLTLKEDRPGQVAAQLDAVERNALHCNSLVSTFVESARDAYPDARPQTVAASSLVKALLDEYPFEHEDERAQLSIHVEQDFLLPGRRDLLYLVLCTLTKNALQVLRGKPGGKLVAAVGTDMVRGRPRQWIKFEDNGPGIEPKLLARLTKVPVKTRSGGTGMGLLFCRRVVQSIGGTLDIASEPQRGTVVTLYFYPFTEANLEEAIA